MNLFKLEPLFRRPKKAKDPTEATRAIAERLYLNRQVMKRPGNAEDDWTKAERILESPIRRVLFHLNQPLIGAEKGAVEPLANWVDHADVFRIIERLSPAIESFGVIVGAIAIPLVLYFAAQNYEERQQRQGLERSQQQAMTDYLNQLSTILLDLDGNLSDSQNAELRTVTTATTLTLLRDPNLDGARKGQVIEFLSQMDLVQGEVVYGPQRLEETMPIIRLHGASLREADLSRASLYRASLVGADLSRADLGGADLGGASLVGADLSGASLFLADLSGASLFLADLGGASLVGADLSGASLREADLSRASLYRADLSGASLLETSLGGASLYRADLSSARNLTWSQLEGAYLCETQLPAGINLDPDRDCEQFQ